MISVLKALAESESSSNHSVWAKQTQFEVLGSLGSTRGIPARLNLFAMPRLGTAIWRRRSVR